MTAALAWQIAASIGTLCSMWQMGNKHVTGPIFGLLSQVAWFGMIWTNQLWGIVPITVAMVFIHARNLRKWLREAA